ncbi:hypothetical protein [uncultured Kordia sp.]|nr:hypothetical protein [uncultured Kordia sp.]
MKNQILNLSTFKNKQLSIETLNIIKGGLNKKPKTKPPTNG